MILAEELDYGIEKTQFINSLPGETWADRLEVFKKRYWTKVGVKKGDSYSLDATFNLSKMPKNIYGKNLGKDYEGTISFLENGLGGSTLPSNAHLIKAYIVFSRPIKKLKQEFSMDLTIQQGEDAFTVTIPFARGVEEGEGKNIRVDITDKEDLESISHMLQAGKGSKISGSVGASIGVKDGTYLLFFQSSASKAKDSSGQENSRKFHLHFSYWYDPIDSYGNSSVHFDNQRATACDPTDPNITDQNCFNAHIQPFKYSKNVFHKITWYTTPRDDRQSYFTYFDKTGTLQTAKNYQIIWYSYRSDKSELNLRYPVPEEWCYAWPDTTVGWGYFKMETWYRYSLYSDDTFVERPPVVKLGEFGPQSLIVDTPMYVKPSITLATIGLSPVGLPWVNETNELSRTWINDYGAYVAGYCNIDLDVEQASGSFGSTISQYTIIEDTYRRIKKTLQKGLGDIGNDERASTHIPRVAISGDIAFTVYAEDSRGRLSDPVFFTVKDGFHSVDIRDQTEDGYYATDEQGNAIYHQGVHIIPYMTPSFDFAAATRVNDKGDISENGTNINVEAAPLYSPIPHIQTGANTNRPYIYFDYTQDGAAWYPTGGPIDISSRYQSYFYGTPDATFYPSVTTYKIRMFVYDEMTKYLKTQRNAYCAEHEIQNDPYEYAYIQVLNLGDGQCTVCLKRDGLGLSIGMMPQTDRNLRCIEISENWEIRHGSDGEQIYYVPDVVFTPAGNERPPKKRKGRIWLQEIR